MVLAMGPPVNLATSNDVDGTSICAFEFSAKSDGVFGRAWYLIE